MANTVTAGKLGKSVLANRLLGRQNSSANAGVWNITCSDPSNVLVFIECTSGSTANATVTVKAPTDGEYTGQGMGDASFNTTGGAGAARHYAYGPFESFRFIKTSTGGRLLTVHVKGSTGATIKGHRLSAVEIVPYV